MSRSSVGGGFVVLLLLTSGLAWPAGQTAPAGATAPVPMILETVKGTIELELWPAEAPKSVAAILELVRTHFYRGLRIHWVQPGVVQFGDPTTRDMTKENTWGMRGSGRPVGVAETSKRPFVRGSVGLAYREGWPATSADSQIFILRYPNAALNGKYANIGRVTKGLDVLDKLEKIDMIKNFRVNTEKKD